MRSIFVIAAAAAAGTDATAGRGVRSALPGLLVTVPGQLVEEVHCVRSCGGK